MCVVETDSIRTEEKKEREEASQDPRAEEVTNRREALAPGPELHNWFWTVTSFIKASEEVDHRRNDGRVLRITETSSDYNVGKYNYESFQNSTLCQVSMEMEES